MLARLITIAEASAARMADFFKAEKEVSYKGEIDLVTQYDVAIEKELIAALTAAFPDFRVIGEESSDKEIGLQPGKVIYVDPIDGTTNFVHRFPFTCISIGVYIDREPYCGVVCAPILGETFSAMKGQGAFLNGKRIKVSNTDKAIRSLVATGFPYDRAVRQAVMPTFAKIIDCAQGVRRAGSAALDLCYVANGVFDLYYESSLRPWDMSAGIIIVQEAGGIVTDTRGKAHDLSTRFLVASNGLVHDEFLAILSAVDKI
ncbi:MAG: inositol monophosphatase [Deferribacteraceae bacterium]|jgi:myo-inositol-1(or 4)-monophosphatase|nr:inositol monophosphatase [Deferribacteraceae bacterium]